MMYIGDLLQYKHYKKDVNVYIGIYKKHHLIIELMDLDTWEWDRYNFKSKYIKLKVY